LKCELIRSGQVLPITLWIGCAVAHKNGLHTEHEGQHYRDDMSGRAERPLRKSLLNDAASLYGVCYLFPVNKGRINSRLDINDIGKRL
jgi:hypothetical protein